MRHPTGEELRESRGVGTTEEREKAARGRETLHSVNGTLPLLSSDSMRLTYDSGTELRKRETSLRQGDPLAHREYLALAHREYLG